MRRIPYFKQCCKVRSEENSRASHLILRKNFAVLLEAELRKWKLSHPTPHMLPQGKKSSYKSDNFKDKHIYRKLTREHCNQLIISNLQSACPISSNLV